MENYFYCKYSGTKPVCSDCTRNYLKTEYKKDDIQTWFVPSGGTSHCINYLDKIMTNEELHELFIDLSARVAYKVKGRTLGSVTCTLVYLMGDGIFKADTYVGHISDKQFVPYLRPMADMSEDEKREYYTVYDSSLADGTLYKVTDWLNLHNIDYRGLIERNLALKAPKDLYQV